MTPTPRQRLVRDPRLQFFRGFLKSPKQVGSIVPSSRFLERRIVRCTGVDHARTVVELGPGTGGTTRALLRAMGPDARLLAIEINPRFARLLRSQIADPRLVVHAGSAAHVADALAKHELEAADVILSGIPFSTMTRNLGLAILRAAHGALAPGGRFVAYQVRDRVEILARGVFGPASVQTEVLNVPPMRVYRWDKQAPRAREGLREP
jgi:phospholipid N-methyltransferase